MTERDSVAAQVAGILASLDVEGPRRLLVVDDEESIRLSLSKFLRSRGYEVQAAESGAQAIDFLRVARFDALLCDVRMPGMAGTEVVPRALELSPDLAILMLTAVTDALTVTEVLAHGAMDYLMKPVDLADLASAVERALRRRDLETRRRRVERLVLDEVARGIEGVRQEQRALEKIAVGVVRSLIEAHEGKDDFLRGNSRRVAETAVAVGVTMGLGDIEVERLRVAAELHDVGNLGIPETLLSKPGPLTPSERTRMQEHVRIGIGVLSPVESLALVLPTIQDHHERWNGSGYPRQLAGEQACLGGRILAAADAFVAITSRRAHRAPVTREAGIAQLSGESGAQLDPDVVAALRQTAVTP